MLRKEFPGRLCQRRASTNHMGLFPRSGFRASENGNHVFTLWKVKLVPFKRLLEGNVVSVARRKEKSVKLIPLLSCTSNIDKHKSALAFTDVQNEVELILARSRLFSRPQSIDQLKICPHHRETLGLGWKRSSTRCDVPALVSSRSAKVKNRPRAERGLTKLASQTVLNETGIFVPVGSGEFS